MSVWQSPLLRTWTTTRVNLLTSLNRSTPGQPRRGSGRSRRGRRPCNLTARRRSATATLDSIRALMMIRAYRVRGHLQAEPRSAGSQDRSSPTPNSIRKSYGFTESDMDRPIFIDKTCSVWRPQVSSQILKAVQPNLLRYHRRGVHAHSGPGAESLDSGTDRKPVHNQHRVQRDRQAHDSRPPDRRRSSSSSFSNKKYTGTKRFGLDGGEAMIPALEQILKRGGQLGLKEPWSSACPTEAGSTCWPTSWASPTAIFSEFQGGASNPRRRRRLGRREVPSGHLFRPGVRRQLRSTCP